MQTEKKLFNDWETWIAEGEVIPYFQPIISCETGEIYGYEVLGRIATRSTLHSIGDNMFSPPRVESLGHFFLSHVDSYQEQISMRSLKKDVDNRIKELALRKLALESHENTCLFLNLSPSSMLEYLSRKTGGLPNTIQIIRELGIDPNRIVIEVTEEPVSANPEILKSVLDIYRAEGYRIAIDDVGSESSNLDRIGLFHPDIIKVDLQMLRRSVFSRNFKEILLTLSRLGESLGSSLLFEGIETEDELFNALNYGSRYLQGYYFSRPEPGFLEIDVHEELLIKNLLSFHERKRKFIQYNWDWEDRIRKALEKLSFRWDDTASQLNFSTELFQKEEIVFFRLYITDNMGKQISPNYYLNRDYQITTDKSYMGKNWSWRPYFFEHFYKKQNSPHNWVVSNAYHDIQENIMLKTFSQSIGEEWILFVDVEWKDMV